MEHRNPTSRLSALAGFILIVLLTTNCEQKSEYQKLVDQELRSGVRNDSLFLGYYFGMTRDEFYEISWALNKEGTLVNGAGAEVVEYLDNLKFAATRAFYPEFKEEKIVQIPVVYSYNGWSPWNRQTFSDSLILDLKNQLTDEFGGQFLAKFDSTSGTNTYVQVQGNREIRLTESSESKVTVLFTDLTQITMEF